MTRSGRVLIWILLLASSWAPAAEPATSAQKHQESAVRDMLRRASTMASGGDLSGAADLANDAVNEAEREFGPDELVVADALAEEARFLEAAGKQEEIQPLLERVLSIRGSKLKPNDPLLTNTRVNLARLYHYREQYEQAESLYRQVLATREATEAKDNLTVASALHDLASLLKDEKRYAEAEPLIRRELAIWEDEYGPDHPNVAFVLESYAAVLRQLPGQERKAASVEARSQRLSESQN